MSSDALLKFLNNLVLIATSLSHDIDRILAVTKFTNLSKDLKVKFEVFLPMSRDEIDVTDLKDPN